MKQRVWELDAFRGICVIGMVFVHFVYDLVELYRFVQWEYPAAFRLLMKGGVFFLLISGICATLGSRSLRRGLVVLGSGLVVTAVTVGMYLLNFSGEGIIIFFGVLHCLGICMILWPLFRKLPWWALALLGLAFVGIGFWFDTLQVQQRWLFPLGLCYEGFVSSDYFPLLPGLGWFLLGALACGVGVYFVMPYYSAGMAEFYACMRAKAIAQGITTEEELSGGIA